MSNDQQTPSSLPRTIHDALFKRIFSDPRHAAAELRAVLPPRIARRIEWATLEAGNINVVGANFKQQHGDLLFHAGLTDGGKALVWLLFEHQSTVDWHVNPHLDRDEFVDTLRPIVGQEAEHTMLSLADRIKIDGRNEGRSEGQRELVLQQLARRFGALSPEIEQRVAGADMDQLKDWAMRLLDARSLDEVFNAA